uniref:Aldedh domain-containing protein n=1 Tax=Steinernema glaseri TaxID=37863 RepID=A0A1I8A9M2_9BILA
MAPHTADAFDILFGKYFDKKVVAVVKGGIPETTDLLTERFDHIIYTGCPPVAKIIMTAAAKHLTPVTLELGGKCPVVIEDDADIETSAKRVAWGKWLNCGQTCLAPDYVLVSKATKDRFVDALRQTISDFYGSNIRNSPDYSRIINQRHFDRLNNLLEKSTSPILFKGGDCDRDDNFIPPVILDASRDDVFMHDEIFGPVLPIITIENLADSIEFINEGEKPLAAYIFTRSEAKLERFYKETSSGAITVNDVIMHITVDTLPFGGVGNSGMGRYRGKFGFDTFTHEKAVLKRGFFGEALLASRYPPLSDSKYNQLKSLTSSRRGFPKFLKNYLPSLPLVFIGIVLGMVLQRYGLR